jgi:hypothetical protein
MTHAQDFIARWKVRHSLGLKTHTQVARSINAVLLIQRKWRVCVTNPKYRVCRSRLLREFKSISVACP